MEPPCLCIISIYPKIYVIRNFIKTKIWGCDIHVFVSYISNERNYHQIIEIYFRWTSVDAFPNIIAWKHDALEHMFIVSMTIRIIDVVAFPKARLLSVQYIYSRDNKNHRVWFTKCFNIFFILYLPTILRLPPVQKPCFFSKTRKFFPDFVYWAIIVHLLGLTRQKNTRKNNIKVNSTKRCSVNYFGYK